MPFLCDESRLLVGERSERDTIRGVQIRACVVYVYVIARVGVKFGINFTSVSLCKGGLSRKRHSRKRTQVFTNSDVIYFLIISDLVCPSRNELQMNLIQYICSIYAGG